MRRTITGFHIDDAGDWVAELSCLHGQHVRHRPPFQNRPWVLQQAGRDERIGAELDCPLCDRAEPPGDLVPVRTAGPFDAESLPAGLRRAHRVAAGTWGRLRVTAGAVHFTMAVEPPITERLEAGDARWLPPEVSHALAIDGPVSLEIDFFVAESRGG
jgi:tellurite methyltransferase